MNRNNKTNSKLINLQKTLRYEDVNNIAKQYARKYATRLVRASSGTSKGDVCKAGDFDQQIFQNFTIEHREQKGNER